MDFHLIEKVLLTFELRRLPKDARLTVSHLTEFSPATLTAIEMALDDNWNRWTTALAVEARRTHLDNGSDVGEAALYLTVSNLSQEPMKSLVIVRVDDEGNAERLESKVVTTLDGEAVVSFLSPRGLSIFAVMVPSVDLEATATPMPTGDATPTAIPRPTPSPTHVGPVPATPTKGTFLPYPTPTRSPSPTTALVPTEIPTHTPTPTPRPTSTATRRPTRTATPVPVPDKHYGVIVHTNDPANQQWFLDTLRTEWFLHFTSGVDAIPSGHEKLIYIGGFPGPSPQKVQEMAQQAPGSVWYIVGEPNRRAKYSVGEIVTQLHDLYEDIRAADPTAKITSPSILNWDFTCLGCGGFQSGHAWVDESRAAYMAQYGEEPPVDIWAIDVYPLDWVNRPTVDHQLAIEQIDSLRQYLDSIPAQRNKPIWITELGIHWGWDDWKWFVEGCEVGGTPLPSPWGTYQTDQVIEYLRQVFDWLDANAASKNIEKWFLLSTYYDITTCNSGAYAGLTLFDAPDTGANLTPVGEFFANRVLGIFP